MALEELSEVREYNPDDNVIRVDLGTQTEMLLLKILC